ncbi:hypothetical protein [Halosolutus gelatinilyticus]|uniref:hypothetical protein n=1 Tax=Halosolutus gelatinilyticus TaxID=2931975 RepID=UPI001FF2CB50|nr:hypothetical protein [Halosolutus gelatinilyticus]
MPGNRYTRRTALELVGTAAVIDLAGVATAQSDENGESGEQLPIVLAGRTEYWYGVAPEEIEGEENPALNFEEGREYELVWINVDGAEHELIVEDEDGGELEASDSSETAGEAVSMSFEASENAAEYYCEYHPETMRGGVEFDGGFDLSSHDHAEHEHEHDGAGNETDEDDGDAGY